MTGGRTSDAMRDIYIAAPFTRRAEAQAVRARLAELGWVSTARWLDTHLMDEMDPQVARHEALEDMVDIHRASAFLLLNEAAYRHESRGGMSAELGIALAKGKPVYIVGGPSHLFHYHPSVVHLTSLEEMPHAEPEV
jgi:nucleoside 2-deoxyribosyltransferase